MRELTEQDFARAIKNPFFDKTHTRVEVAIKNEDLELFKKQAEENGERLERLLRRCLANTAKEFREFED
ncbi:MAG: hypothetical protein LBM93_08635 [Oscillospiraceae bacterium]|jgi:predicted DNA binding CopG/RHH family protein|nr:hypothetical protein [Oscillospiraceae bacterium]